jgi:hypothetical protein
MAQIESGGAHGLYKILAALVGTDGLSYGVAGEGISAGSSSDAYVLDYPVNANITVPDGTTIDFTASDQWLTSYQYGPSSLGSFDFELENYDTNFVAMCSGTLSDQTTNALWTENTENAHSGNFPAISLIFIYRIQSFETATFGATKYFHTIYPRCQVRPKRNAQQYQSKSTMPFQVTPLGGARHVNGHPFGANLGAFQNRVVNYNVITDNPLMLTTAKANATSLTITSAYQPVTSAVGTSSSTKNQICRYVTSTNVATLGVADTITPADGEFDIGTSLTVASGDIATALFETAFLAAS